LARGAPASYAGAASATGAVLTELGVAGTKPVIADGSGLSRRNRVAPSLLTSVLTLAASDRRPELSSLFGGLPVAGWSGTLRERFVGPGAAGRAGAGVVRAKTGTLSGVNAISGVVVTAQGRLLAFALLADRVPVGALDAQEDLDRVAGQLAACGCR
jgi:D-alanyl-D-alanine carboxypeptidase/D-alanyl-D-alanine-endopeptidase (penicillin-binding protein 4)